ncbi:MAG: phosphoenolpyruvate--protein phosphotransferase [SAR324 cluster bacterium]|nr:phosphoenolpyruvate--protein phosphotransferase [SAR324 cluster bacterium]
MKRNYFSLLCDVGELASILAGSLDIESFLQRLVTMISHHLKTEVCSIYLYDDMTEELVLQAATGLIPGAVGMIRLKEGEGLVGRTMQERRPILEKQASQSPQFKYFPDMGEEPFESFLAIPIVRESKKIGVLALQCREKNYFRQKDITALRAVSTQLAGTIENARLLISLRQEYTQKKKSIPEITIIKGKVASKGFSHGPLEVLRALSSASNAKSELASNATLQDLLLAIEATSQQIEELQIQIADRMPEVITLIFNAHLLMLKDPNFTGSMVKKVEDGMNVEDAIEQVIQYFVKIFASSKDNYMKEKAKDVEDIGRRLLDNLMLSGPKAANPIKGSIIVTRDLYPSEIVKFAIEGINGIVLVGGGITSHISIIARSLQIPLIIVENEDLLSVGKGSHILLDDEGGNVYVNPSLETIHAFSKENTTRQERGSNFLKMSDTTRTVDGTQVQLMANINLLNELSLAVSLKTDGIGLYRTEFPFLIRHTLPSEEEQYLIYSQLVEQMKEKEITFRTLDVGGDKVLTYYSRSNEINPGLGLRSIRFSLKHQDIFKQQIRAILRAGAGARDLRIMFPMISSLDELYLVRQIVEDCISTLNKKSFSYYESPAIGMMVELPAVVETIEEFARAADFFSIGTNDFIQFMLAVDRANDQVSSYYCPHHPAVLRSLAKVVSAACKENIDVSVCGEMAHQQEYTAFLLGIGVRKLSVDPQFLPAVQATIEKISVSEAKQEAELLLRESTIANIEQRLQIGDRK